MTSLYMTRFLSRQVLVCALALLALLSWQFITAAEPTPLPTLIPQTVGLNYPSQMIISPDGTHLVILAGLRSVVWNLRDGVIDGQPSLAGGIIDAVISADSRYLLCGRNGQQGTKTVAWDMRQDTVVQVWPDIVNFFSPLPDRKLVWTARDNFCTRNRFTSPNTLTLREFGSGKIIRSIPNIQGYIAAISPGGSKAFTITADIDKQGYFLCNFNYVIWDLATGKEISRLTGIAPQTGDILSYSQISAAFNPDSKYLAFADLNSVGIWDTSTGKQVKTLTCQVYKEGPTIQNSQQLAYSPDGKWLAINEITLTGQRILLWNMATDDPPRVLVNDQMNEKKLKTIGIIFTPDSATLITSNISVNTSISESSVISLWDITTGKVRRQLSAPLVERGTSTSDVSRDGKQVAVSYGKTIVLWDLTCGCLAREIHFPKNTFTGKVFFTPDGKQLITSANIFTTMKTNVEWRGRVMVWDTATGELLRDFPAHRTSVNYMALSPDGKLLATDGNQDGGVKLWDTTDWTITRQFKNTEMAPNLLFSPNGNSMCWTSESQASGNRLTIISPATGTSTESHKESTFYTLLAYSPDSRHLLAYRALTKLLRREIAILDAQTGAQTATLRWPDEIPQWISANYRFSEDSNTVYGLFNTSFEGVQESGMLVSWNTDTGEILRKEKRFGACTTSETIFVASSSPYAMNANDLIPQLWDMRQVLTEEQPKPLATFHWFENGQWLITTPQGYFDCSPEITNALVWKLDGNIYPYQQYEKQYHRPDLVRKALAR